jgi:hypothetical protein
METQLVDTPVNPNMLAFKAALTYSVYFLVLLYLFNWMGINQGDPNASFAEKAIAFIASWAPFVLAILYVQTTFKKELGGFISFGRAFSTGFKVAAYTGLFLAILMVLYYKVLDKEAFQKVIDTALTTAGDDENKRKGIEMMKPYMTFFIAFGAALSYTFFGLVISLISAAIIKKEQPLFFAGEE